MKMRSIVALSALVAMSNVSHADAPEVPSAAPYIVLSDNLDEPNGFGFCMDTLGPGQSDLMQTHSCKPHKEGEARDYGGFDTRFTYDSTTGQIESYPFSGVCMQALLTTTTTVFALLECSDHSRQKFVYNDIFKTQFDAGVVRGFGRCRHSSSNGIKIDVGHRTENRFLIE